jgi:hypothetical protein
VVAATFRACAKINVVAQFIGLLNDFVDEPHK